MKKGNTRCLLVTLIILLPIIVMGCSTKSSDNQTRAVPYDQSYIGSKVTLEYHTATCAIGQSIQLPDRMLFKSAAEAEAAGYRPCSTCIPAK